ncbi:MAG: DUF4364 family protein [Oscillospiraceae bacterium]|nr:DUF4364 family protein [Oscillospiraceae bacterium]
MEYHGFINDMLDVKILILFVTDRLLHPVRLQTLYELCMQDDKLSYFSVVEAVPEMVEAGQLSETEDGFVITEKGRELALITKDSLAFPVAQRAARAVERFNQGLRRDSFIRTEVLEQPRGDALAVMRLDDEMGNLITIEYACPSPRQAALLTRAFPARAEKLYRLITETLTAKDAEPEQP